MTTGAVHGSVRLWLRLEGLVVLVLAVYLYARGGHSWVVFATLFFLPDISFAGYLAGSRVGAAVYNVAHSYVGPLLLAVALLTTGTTLMWALIWAAHVGFDRALGHDLGVAVGVDVLPAAAGEADPLDFVGEQQVQPLGQVLWVLGPVQQAAGQFAQHFREGAVLRLDDGNDAFRTGDDHLGGRAVPD